MESAKYLGCTFTSDLRWNDHVNNICNNRTIGFLKRNLNIGSTTVKQNAYKALVRPLVEYASPVWDPYHQTEIDWIEMVQRRAARYVWERPFNLKGGVVMVFFLKKYSDSQCCWKKYSDFDGGKKKIWFRIFVNNLMLNSGKKKMNILTLLCCPKKKFWTKQGTRTPLPHSS